MFPIDPHSRAQNTWPRVSKSALLKFEEIKLIRYEHSLRGRRVPIFAPRQPIRNAFATARANGEWYVVGQRSAFRTLSRLAMFAAVHHPAIVYVRLQGKPRPPFDQNEPHDLVLVQSSTQFRPAAWKQIRNNLAPGRPCSFSVPEPDIEMDRPDARRVLDRFDLAQHSATVFVTGSELLLRYFAHQLRRMARCETPGDHDHFFELARNEHRCGQVDDMTMMFWRFVKESL